MRNHALLTILFLVGCGSFEPADGQTTWNVSLGSWETPTCEGVMRVALSPSPDFAGQTDMSGTWSCGAFTGQAAGQLFADGRAFLNLESNPGNWNGVRGELSGDAIVGDIRFDEKTQPFVAVRQ